MKNSFLLLLTLFLFSACNSTKKTIPNDPLHGQWTIASYSAFMPSIPEYNSGDVVWDFDTKKSTVTITKKDKEKHRFSKAPGTYTYTIKDKMIIVDGSDYFYKVEDGKLTLDDNTDPRMSKDLPVIVFARMGYKD